MIMGRKCVFHIWIYTDTIAKRDDDEDNDDEEEDADAMCFHRHWYNWRVANQQAWSVCQGSYDYDPARSLRDGYLSRDVGARKRYKYVQRIFETRTMFGQYWNAVAPRLL